MTREVDQSRSAPPLGGSYVERVLAEGEMDVLGRLPRASNATLFVRITHEDVQLPAVYKPRRGERPLWDFPNGTLYRREVASYVVSQAMGFGLVPPTVERGGEFGPGSVQLFVTEDTRVDMFDLVERGHDVLAPMAALDVVINNADRKVSHCIIDDDGRLWGIDHGLTFNEDHKLRTVLWAWAGDHLPPELRRGISVLARTLDDTSSDLVARLAQLLDDAEIEALADRAAELLTLGRFPEPDPDAHCVPWPPY